MPTEHLVFSYGTLRLPSVQAALFGGPVPMVDDALVGWRLDEVEITDPAVIAASGTDRHLILRPGGTGDLVAGAVLTVDDAGLEAVDDYEVDDYVRVMASTIAGREVWVFVAAE